jgi:hypothetical protein
MTDAMRHDFADFQERWAAGAALAIKSPQDALQAIEVLIVDAEPSILIKVARE